MSKLIVIPALLKAHVDSYTKKDGTFVQSHDDKRQAAAPKSASPVHASQASRMVASHLHKMGWGEGKLYHAENGDHGVAPSNGKISVFKKNGMEHVSSFDHDPYNFTESHAKALAEKIHGSIGGADPYGHPQVVGKAEKLQGGDASKAHGFHFAGKQYSASGKEGKSFHDGTPVRHFSEMTESGNDDGQHVWMDHSGRVHADSKSEVKGLRAAYEAHAKKAAKPRVIVRKP